MKKLEFITYSFYIQIIEVKIGFGRGDENYSLVSI